MRTHRHRLYTYALAAVALSALAVGSCYDTEPRACAEHDDCCPDGPAYMCVSFECHYDERIADDPVQYQARERACTESD